MFSVTLGPDADGGPSDRGPLLPGCPRCAAPVEERAGSVICPEHGAQPTLWRAADSTYDGFGALLIAAAGFPAYLPWPVAAGWRVSDFALVADARGAHATMTCCSGSSELDGPVDLVVVTEEPGIGVGARCAGLTGADPGPEVGRGPAAAHVPVDGHPVALWTVSTSAVDAEFDRSVLVGEARGRWLWLVLRPPSALLFLGEEPPLRDVTSAGPALVELEFGGPAPAW